jgi:hypothetical protein
MFCDGYIDTFISVFRSVEAFLGGLSTNPDLPIMELANVEFLKSTMNY